MYLELIFSYNTCFLNLYPFICEATLILKMFSSLISFKLTLFETFSD